MMIVFTRPNAKAKSWFRNAMNGNGICISADMDLALLPFLPFCWVVWVVTELVRK